ncbi:MAG: hypothetical protein CMC82_02040 [Flavobacteriaceae bacterium]|nr:hypothetical protein [Flavobacteriaceae bacterium]
MSDQKLLNENTIRRFMKLANTESLSETFVTEMYGSSPAGRTKDADKPEKPAKPEKQEEGSYKDKKDPPLREEEDLDNLEEQEEPEAEDDMGDEMDMEMDLGADMDADMDAEPEAGAADMSLTEEEAEILIALGERLQAAMGEEGDMGDMGEEDDMADMGDMDPDAGEEAPAKADVSAMMENEDDLVQEVLKRVTKRLVDAKINSRK